ncbi:alpha-1A adrenergic receptor [Callorhinchus milii]|uniref:alpha-1A adrenergic receptor n=1 Tax=Callorhinchus milii TaxID=7868 RepID=UPI0004572D49|nr:alpha-1A adrenergic receptor [Callorhinchus milii]|eukprot:gi/632942721/ref/XP_007886563.1/ PREDICTED: alpha-1A adrenergic receptor-like [Callorhinchus milii]
MVGPPDHSTCSICCCTPVNRILTVIFMILLTIAVLFGNSVSLVVFLGTKQFRTPHGYLKASLAVADLAVGVVVVPFSVYSEVFLMLKGAPTECALGTLFGDDFQPCTVIGTVFAGCTLVSISTIFLLTIERSIAILKPLHKEAVITRKRTVSLIGVSWIASFFLAVSPLMFSEEIVLEYNTCSRMCNFSLLAGSFPQSGWKILLLFPAFDFTLLGATVVINILSLSSIRQYSKQRRVLAKSNHSCRLSRPSFSDIKAGKTIGALTLAFTASFTPIAVYVVGNVLGYQWCEFSFIAFWILTSNSCWNVIIYSVRDQKFRQRALELFSISKSAISTDR